MVAALIAPPRFATLYLRGKNVLLGFSDLAESERLFPPCWLIEDENVLLIQFAQCIFSYSCPFSIEILDNNKAFLKQIQ